MIPDGSEGTVKSINEQLNIWSNAHVLRRYVDFIKLTEKLARSPQTSPLG